MISDHIGTTTATVYYIELKFTYLPEPSSSVVSSAPVSSSPVVIPVVSSSPVPVSSSPQTVIITPIQPSESEEQHEKVKSLFHIRTAVQVLSSITTFLIGIS